MIRICAPAGPQASLVPQSPDRHPGRLRRSRARRRQRRQAALAGRRAARPVRRRRARRAAIWSGSGPGQQAAVRRRRRRHAVRRRCVRLRRVLARARARARPGGGDRRDHPGRPGRLHRGAAGGERQDPRLPEPPVVVPARRIDARVHRQARPGRSIPRSPATSSGPASNASWSDCSTGVRLPRRVAAVEREHRRARRRRARPGVRRDGTVGGGPPPPRPDVRWRDRSRRRWRSPTGGHRRRAPVLFDDVVKPELRTGTGERLQKRLYCLRQQLVVGRPRSRASSWRRRSGRPRSIAVDGGAEHGERHRQPVVVVGVELRAVQPRHRRRPARRAARRRSPSIARAGPAPARRRGRRAGRSPWPG